MCVECNKPIQFFVRPLGHNFRCFAFPSDKMNEAKQTFDLYKERAAIYLLTGRSDPYDDIRPSLYVGKTIDKNGWGERIPGDHSFIGEWYPEYWDFTFVFTSDDDFWTDLRLKYTENRLYNMAEDVGNYHLVNHEEPSKGSRKPSCNDIRAIVDFTKQVAITLSNPDFCACCHAFSD